MKEIWKERRCYGTHFQMKAANYKSQRHAKGKSRPWKLEVSKWEMWIRCISASQATRARERVVQEASMRSASSRAYLASDKADSATQLA
ncbi:hypothetical protein Tco_1369360 [Tanacetum coccineum]